MQKIILIIILAKNKVLKLFLKLAWEQQRKIYIRLENRKLWKKIPGNFNSSHNHHSQQREAEGTRKAVLHNSISNVTWHRISQNIRKWALEGSFLHNREKKKKNLENGSRFWFPLGSLSLNLSQKVCHILQ